MVNYPPDIVLPPEDVYEKLREEIGTAQLEALIDSQQPTCPLPRPLKFILDKIKENPKRFWKILFLITLAFCFAFALYQVITILQIFFQYPHTVSVDIGYKERLTFPGITFCSSIGVRRSELERMPGFLANFEKNKEQELLDRYYQLYMEKTTINKLISQGLNLTEFIVIPYTRCALDEVHNNATERVTCKEHFARDYLETIQGTSICYTLFHEAATSKLAKVPVPSGFTQSIQLISSDKQDKPDKQNKSDKQDKQDKPDSKGPEFQTIQPLEIIRVVVNFTLHEATNTDEPPSGTVAVHDLDIIRSGRLQSHFIRPGGFYDIFIEIQESHLLPAPYETNCHLYRANLHLYEAPGEDPHPFFDAPLSSADCITGCLGKITINSRCRCWPPEIPYMRGDRQQQFTDEIKMCDWIKLGRKLDNSSTTDPKEKALHIFRECFSSHDEKCKKKCKQECLRTRIKTSVRRMEWPSKERIETATDDKVMLNHLNNLKNCCAVVSIRMASEDITKYKYDPKYEPIEFVSYVGGIVSLWIGFTFIGVVDYLKAIVKMIMRMKRGGGGDDENEEKAGQETEKVASNAVVPAYDGSIIDPNNNHTSILQGGIPWYMGSIAPVESTGRTSRQGGRTSRTRRIRASPSDRRGVGGTLGGSRNQWQSYEAWDFDLDSYRRYTSMTKARRQ